jgi:hypothetical protein
VHKDRRVRAMQAGQTRSCGARTHTHKHPLTETPVVGSQAVCAAALPSGSPRPVLPSTQFRTVENLSTVQPHKLRTCFQVPTDSQGLWGAHEQYLSDQWASDMRFCVCGSPRGDLSHIAGLTIGRSRSDFSGVNQRDQDHTCGG